MNILITISNSYVPYAAVLLQSLSDKNPGLSFDVYIICPDISEENKNKLQNQFINENNEKDAGCLINIIFPDMRDEITNEINDMSSRLVKSANSIVLLRLYASDILPDSMQQILYIDVDTIVASSLEELAKMTLDDDTALAAVKDLVRYDDYSRLGLDESKHIYFNAGIMLLNLDYWRRNNIGKKCLDLLLKYSTLYYLPDQDALNVVCQGHVHYLHPKYNCLIFFYARREFLKTRVRKEEFDNVIEAAKSPAIIHYVFVNKPWYKGGYMPQRDVWLESLKKTEWRDMPIVYKNGIKGRLRNILKIVQKYVLPLFGLQDQSDIF